MFPNNNVCGGHLAKIPHGTVESQRPSLPRNPVYISNKHVVIFFGFVISITRFIRVKPQNKPDFSLKITFILRINRCTYQNYLPCFHLKNLDLSSRIIQPRICPPGKLSRGFYIWYETAVSYTHLTLPTNREV